MTQDEVNEWTILRAVVGSRALGLETPESDTDEMGVCIEGIEEAMGLDMPFEQFVRTGPDRIREGPDLQIYGLRKFLKLALSGNPTILLLLFIPTEKLLKWDARGSHLRDLAPYIVSKEAGKAYLGYMQAQRMRLTGERGQKGINRPELVAKYGYDTKYAMHVLRLGMQGMELLKTGRISLPIPEPDRSYLRSVRDGALQYNDVLTEAGELEADLKDAIDTSPLPEHPDRPYVQDWMVSMYLENWKARQKPLFAKEML